MATGKKTNDSFFSIAFKLTRAYRKIPIPVTRWFMARLNSLKSGWESRVHSGGKNGRKKSSNLKLKSMNLRAIARAGASISATQLVPVLLLNTIDEKKTKSINSITFHSIFNKSQMAKSRQKKTLCDLKICVLE